MMSVLSKVDDTFTLLFLDPLFFWKKLAATEINLGQVRNDGRKCGPQQGMHLAQRPLTTIG